MVSLIMSGRAGIHRRNKLANGLDRLFLLVCVKDGSARIQSALAKHPVYAVQIQVAHQEKARRYAPTKFHQALELHHRPPSQLTTHCDEGERNGRCRHCFCTDSAFTRLDIAALSSASSLLKSGKRPLMYGWREHCFTCSRRPNQ